MNFQAVYDFVNAINGHDIDKIYLLMTDDHTFIDSYGNETTGKGKMKEGWEGYFQLFPDYKIEITDIIQNNDTLAVFGFAGGTFKGIRTDKNFNFWRIPASWKVIVSDHKIKQWQVYADTKIPFDILGRNR